MAADRRAGGIKAVLDAGSTNADEAQRKHGAACNMISGEKQVNEQQQSHSAVVKATSQACTKTAGERSGGSGT